MSIDKKLLENKVQQLIKKEASKFSSEEIQVEEKGVNIDPVKKTS